MTCINDPIPWELWVVIANFSHECDYNLFFTNKKFFSLINHYKFNSNVIEYAIKQGNLNVLKYILRLKYEKNNLIDNKRFEKIGPQKCLEISCEQGRLEIVKFLVKQGTDIHIDDNCAVRWASRNGHLEVVKFLVKKGADIQANNNLAVQWASRNGHLKVVKFLVKKGVDIQADNNNAVRWASRKGLAV
ncbi:ankyrin containing protein [Cotonvirus japonicus]|uniref:Ankyrin containing protein n=1 Tax=Cotonvirus japonicus TaxID=2811091 RepID=A0ABM7NUA0_9VIRU|nr:ankyrin containing protein [Cotonvirus japonicus]BCS83709.1 ankyrin containing protein [Cotonvirus japonicus]